MTTTSVPSGAKSHSAIASARPLADAAVRLRRAELAPWSAPACRRRPGCRGSRSRRRVALGEPDEVLHRPGVVDAPRPARSASRPRRCRGRGCRRGCRRPGRCAAPSCRRHQPDPLPALAEDDPLAGAGVGRQRGVVGRVELGLGRASVGVRRRRSSACSDAALGGRAGVRGRTVAAAGGLCWAVAPSPPEDGSAPVPPEHGDRGDRQRRAQRGQPAVARRPVRRGGPARLAHDACPPSSCAPSAASSAPPGSSATSR